MVAHGHGGRARCLINSWGWQQGCQISSMTPLLMGCKNLTLNGQRSSNQGLLRDPKMSNNSDQDIGLNVLLNTAGSPQSLPFLKMQVYLVRCRCEIKTELQSGRQSGRAALARNPSGASAMSLKIGSLACPLHSPSRRMYCGHHPARIPQIMSAS